MKIILAIVLAFAFAGPAFADDAMSVADQINQKWVAASAKGDAAAWTALYSTDGSVLPEGVSEPIIGQANIRKFFDKVVAGPKPENFTTAVSEAARLDPKTNFATGTYAFDSPGQKQCPVGHVLTRD